MDGVSEPIKANYSKSSVDSSIIMITDNSKKFQSSDEIRISYCLIDKEVGKNDSNKTSPSNHVGYYVNGTNLISSRHPKVPVIVYMLFTNILILIGIKRDTLYSIYERIVMRRLGLIGPAYAGEAILLLIILLITATYEFINMHSYKYISQFYESVELMVYLKSLSLFEIYVYLMVFVIVVYLTELIFGHEVAYKLNRPVTTSPKQLVNSIRLVTVSRLWEINSIFMLVALLSMDAIILRSNQLNTQDWLADYYGEIAQLSATILAIVIAIYTSSPANNILSWRRKDGRGKM